MKPLHALAAACLLMSLSMSASAADTGTAAAPKQSKATKTHPAPASADSADQGAKPIKMSQQDRMRMCNKQATGKRGAERKTLMKSCLTTKKA